MSKFIDKLNQILQPSSPPMGFGRKQSAPLKAGMLLIASGTSDNFEGLAKGVSGADGILLSCPKLNEEVLAGLAKTLPDLPWGVRLSGQEQEKLAELAKSGADFVAFSAGTMSLSLLSYEKLGKILEVEPSLADGLLRAVNEIPLDAVLLNIRYEGGSSLNWHHLMLCRHLADLVTKPLVVVAPELITGKELLALWQAGVSGVVVPAERVGKLKEETDKLSFPERRLSRMGAILPRLSQKAPEEPEEEEEEE